MTPFLRPGELVDGDLQLLLARRYAMRSGDHGASCHFKMVRLNDRQELGYVELRLSDDETTTQFNGHIGYVVWPGNRGHRYAARSVRLLLPLARQQGLTSLWITCDPANLASRRTCELAGASLVEIIDLPPGLPMFRRDRKQLCRYQLSLTPAAVAI